MENKSYEERLLQVLHCWYNYDIHHPATWTELRTVLDILGKKQLIQELDGCVEGWCVICLLKVLLYAQVSFCYMIVADFHNIIAPMPVGWLQNDSRILRNVFYYRKNAMKA